MEQVLRGQARMEGVKAVGRGEVAFRNDIFRRKGYGVVATRGVLALDGVPGLLAAVRCYTNFNEDNDPHGEHDFGSLEWEEQKVFWKIDYYDRDLVYWENPLSQNCRRVLTVMLADEY